MIIPIRQVVALLGVVSLAVLPTQAIVYRPDRGQLAQRNLLARQASSAAESTATSDASDSSAAGGSSSMSASDSSSSDSATSSASSSAASESGSAGAAGGKKKSPALDSSAGPFQFGNPTQDYPGVLSANQNGKTNPDKPKLDTPINQKSESRLATINSVDDWCTFGPKDNSKPLGDVEAEVVAYCTKPRNDARVIPDGTVTAAHFVKTPLYVQVMALGDFTKINFAPGDTGGELDPHGATNKGNPIGGNVTSNISGKDEFYEEWMNYVGYNIMCFRVCIAGSDEAPPGTECEHTLDRVGCNWVMPGNYAPDSFDTCDADPAYPPGIYVVGGETSSFQQYATGVFTDDDGQSHSYTNGNKKAKTPTAAQSLPSSSNCKAAPSIANGIKSIVPTSSKPTTQESANSKPSSGSGSGSGSGADKQGNDESNTDKGSNGAVSLVPTMATLAAAAAVAAGAIFI